MACPTPGARAPGDRSRRSGRRSGSPSAGKGRYVHEAGWGRATTPPLNGLFPRSSRTFAYYTLSTALIRAWRSGAISNRNRRNRHNRGNTQKPELRYAWRVVINILTTSTAERQDPAGLTSFRTLERSTSPRPARHQILGFCRRLRGLRLQSVHDAEVRASCYAIRARLRRAAC